MILFVWFSCDVFGDEECVDLCCCKYMFIKIVELIECYCVIVLD